MGAEDPPRQLTSHDAPPPPPPPWSRVRPPRPERGVTDTDRGENAEREEEGGLAPHAGNGTNQHRISADQALRVNPDVTDDLPTSLTCLDLTRQRLFARDLLSDFQGPTRAHGTPPEPRHFPGYGPLSRDNVEKVTLDVGSISSSPPS